MRGKQRLPSKEGLERFTKYLEEVEKKQHVEEVIEENAELLERLTDEPSGETEEE